MSKDNSFQNDFAPIASDDDWKYHEIRANMQREIMSKLLADRKAKVLTPTDIRSIKPKQAAEAIVLLAEGESIRNTARRTNLSTSSVQKLKRREATTVEKQKKYAASRFFDLATKAQVVAEEKLDMIMDDEEQLKEVRLNELGVLMGISTDKFATLNGEATTVIEHRKGASIEDAQQAILEAQERIKQAQGRVIDAESGDEVATT